MFVINNKNLIFGTKKHTGGTDPPATGTSKFVSTKPVF
jgi:hypothetical protein